MPDSVTRLQILEESFWHDRAAWEARERAHVEREPQLCAELRDARSQGQAIDIVQRHYRAVADAVSRAHPQRTATMNEWLKLRPLRPDEERRACDGVRVRGR